MANWHQRRRDLYDAQGGLCHICGKEMRRSPAKKRGDTRGFTLDHIIPRAYGARKNKNVLLAHWQCNNARGHKPATPEQLAYLAVVLERLAARNSPASKGRA